jgi:hypothetical protein
MFWNPNQTGQRKQKESPLARNTHQQTSPRKPANPNRKPKLLETHGTPTKQTTEARSNREETTAFTIDFAPARRVTANRPRIRQTRRKRENSPLNFVAIKRRPDRLFS